MAAQECTSHCMLNCTLKNGQEGRYYVPCILLQFFFFMSGAHSLSYLGGYKRSSQSDFGIEHLVMSIVQSLLLCCWKSVFAMTSAFSWQNSITLCPASFCTPGPNLTVTPCCYKILYFILCYSWVTFHGMYVCAYTPHFLCPFICQWIFGLFLCLGYYEQCCCEHCGACIFLKLRVLSGWLLFLPLHGC